MMKTKAQLPHFNFTPSNSAHLEIAALTAVSPIDGRYHKQVAGLQNICSESALIAWRVFIEIEWLKTMIVVANSGGNVASVQSSLSQDAQQLLAAIVANFSPADVAAIKKIEAVTNHDVKAVEYFIKDKISVSKELNHYRELVHLGATSEDINNLAYALMIRGARAQCLLPQLTQIIAHLRSLARAHATAPMLARTHGQPATPTTVGKECAHFVVRLEAQHKRLAVASIMGKFNGATGNYNALCVAYPEHDWRAICQNFVESFGLEFNPYTTQIEPHDYIADLCHTIAHINTILMDLCRDMWGYIALNYFVLPPLADVESRGEVGSSTMPHKINPIDFENAEGNLGMANALLYHFATKLPISRWQRDLSDSTVMRNLGVGFAYSFIAYKALLKGLSKIEVNREQLNVDLEQHWEVLGEAIQTTMRRYGIHDAYEKLKALTRGKKIDAQMLQEFIRALDIPDEAKRALLTLTPQTYLGYAVELVEKV